MKILVDVEHYINRTPFLIAQQVIVTTDCDRSMKTSVKLVLGMLLEAEGDVYRQGPTSVASAEE